MSGTGSLETRKELAQITLRGFPVGNERRHHVLVAKILVLSLNVVGRSPKALVELPGRPADAVGLIAGKTQRLKRLLKVCADRRLVIL